MLVEVIACTFADAVVARDAGADRVELCLAIEVGGLTPYIPIVEQVGSLAPFPFTVMIRPEPGEFVGYLDMVLCQIYRVLELGLNHVQFVTGILTPQRNLDLEAMRSIRQATKGHILTCHRCFDLTPFPLLALEQLIDLGFDRVLTSGQAPSAQLGVNTIASMVESAGDRIEVLAGVGIRPHNVREIISATGVRQVHASCFADTPSSMQGRVDFGPTLRVSAEKVKALVAAAKAV